MGIVPHEKEGSMKKVILKAAEVLKVSASLYLELASSALKLIPARR